MNADPAPKPARSGLPNGRTGRVPAAVTRSYDLVVIGGGAGGLVAAREARRRRASVVIVQDGPVGGDCTFTGCVPSKALLAAAASGVDFDEAMARVHRAVERIAATEDADALAADGHRRGRRVRPLHSPTAIEVDGRTIRSNRFVVATGARPDRARRSPACESRRR